MLRLIPGGEGNLLALAKVDDDLLPARFDNSFLSAAATYFIAMSGLVQPYIAIGWGTVALFSAAIVAPALVRPWEEQ